VTRSLGKNFDRALQQYAYSVLTTPEDVMRTALTVYLMQKATKESVEALATMDGYAGKALPCHKSK
jgi:hypothetical protein